MMGFTRRQILIGAGSVTLASSLPALARETVVIGGPAFGTSWRLTLVEGADAKAAKTAIQNVVNSVDLAMSPFRAESEISNFNRLATTDWIPMSQETHAVIWEALRVAEVSGGAFDPTIGPIVRRHGFGPISNRLTGSYQGIDIRVGAARKDHADLSLDLCGVAKGYALDLMVTALDGLDIADYFIELGGEVFARGQHPAGRLWQVGIERPLPGELQFQHILGLNGLALATSGDAANSYDVGGLRYSHIIDPRTQEPARNGIASVSVLAASGMRADALATALTVLGPDQGVEFAEKEGIAALFIVRDGGTLREIITGDFAKHLLV